MMRSFRVDQLTTAATVAAVLALVLPAPASAALDDVFTGLASPPIACTVQSGGGVGGQRWCSGTPSRVRTFDGTPIDVSVALPPKPASGPDGGFPVIGVFHGWGGHKITPETGTAQNWLDQGYAVFSMTDRGWHESCGTPASRMNLPGWASCAKGQIQMMDFRYEVRDAQFMLGQLVDEGVIDPNRIGVKGGSYGGIASIALGTLNDRTMLEDGTLTPWLSPSGVPLHIAAAAPSALASDIVATQLPNGSTLDYAAQSPYFGPRGDLRVGVLKSTVFNGFLDGAIFKGYPSDEFLALGDAANGPGPYDSMAASLADLQATHSAAYLDDSSPPAPMLLSNGFSDDFVPADESIRMYNRIRADNPSVPVAMFFGDLGHARSQDKPAETNALRQLHNDWLNHYVRGVGPAPLSGIEMYGITCPSTAPSSGPFHFDRLSDIGAGEIRLTKTGTKTIAASGALYGGQFSAPDGSACASSPAADNPATANYHVAAASGSGYDVAGSPTLLMRLDATGPSDQLVARLLDVAPDGSQRLIDRGMLRPKLAAPSKVQVLQLHPNLWRIGPGHAIKLELMADDAPYSKVNATAPDEAAQHPIKVRDLQLRIPTKQGPGASDGLVKKPLARYLPVGYVAAADFVGMTTAKPPDFDSPRTRISKLSMNSRKRSAKVRFRASDHGGSGVRRFECRLTRDKGLKHWRQCRSPKHLRHLRRGLHTLRVRAIDRAGNVEQTPAKHRFRIRKHH